MMRAGKIANFLYDITVVGCAPIAVMIAVAFAFRSAVSIPLLFFSAACAFAASFRWRASRRELPDALLLFGSACLGASVMLILVAGIGRAAGMV